MVEKVAEYQYSSAAYHCGLVANNIITDYNIGVNVQEYEDYLMMMPYTNPVLCLIIFGLYESQAGSQIVEGKENIPKSRC
jgi:hypothetical protein